MREPAGSTSDLKRQSAVCQSGGEIDAVLSLRETDVQQAAILEAKYAPAGQFRKEELICTCARARRPGIIGDRSYKPNGECA
jgi:hypothetical protein